MNWIKVHCGVEDLISQHLEKRNFRYVASACGVRLPCRTYSRIFFDSEDAVLELLFVGEVLRLKEHGSSFFLRVASLGFTPKLTEGQLQNTTIDEGFNAVLSRETDEIPNNLLGKMTLLKFSHLWRSLKNSKMYFD